MISLMANPDLSEVKHPWFFFAVAFALLLWITLPYLAALWGSGKDLVFAGFLLNPLDGNSYLAKMYQGYQGHWRFTLPYSAEKGQGAYLFLFYLLLGHLGRILGLPLIVVYHVARLLASLGMLLALWLFLGEHFPRPEARRAAFIASTLGLGMGWLAIPWGVMTSDLWVAEAFPFLSAFTNPHFPLALGLVLLVLTLGQGGKGLWYGLVSALLALVSPFGVMLALAILTVVAIWEAGPDYKRLCQSKAARRAVWVFLGGAPIVAYQAWAIASDPILAEWNAQNITPSPPVWDVALSFSPWVGLALLWVGLGLKRGDPAPRLLVTWLLLGWVLIYLPWGLQRRWMMGMYIPVVGLAMHGLGRWIQGARRFWMAAMGLFTVVVPTQLLILLAVLHGIRAQDPKLFITRDEMAAYAWIETHTAPEALILASPESGLLIPAHTGRRVVYGHPFETVEADRHKAWVEAFFSGEGGQGLHSLLLEADYIFYGPREQRLGGDLDLARYAAVYRQGQVTLYATR